MAKKKKKKKMTNAQIKAKAKAIKGTNKKSKRPKNVTIGSNGEITFPLTGGANALLKLAEGYAYAAALRPKQEKFKELRDQLVEAWESVTRDCQGGQTHSS